MGFSKHIAMIIYSNGAGGQSRTGQAAGTSYTVHKAPIRVPPSYI